METIVRNLDLMNKLRSKAFTIAGVADQKESYFESQRNIAKEVLKIRALVRQKNTCILAKHLIPILIKQNCYLKI